MTQDIELRLKKPFLCCLHDKTDSTIEIIPGFKNKIEYEIAEILIW